MTDEAEAMIPLDDAAAQLGLSKDQCLRLHRRGQFAPIYKFGRGLYRVRPDEISDWVAARRMRTVVPVSSIRRPGFDRRDRGTGRPGRQPA